MRWLLDRGSVFSGGVHASAPQDLDDEIAEGIDLDDVAGMHDCGRGIFLDQRRPGDAIAGEQRRAIVGRRIDEARPASAK